MVCTVNDEKSKTLGTGEDFQPIKYDPFNNIKY